MNGSGVYTIITEWNIKKTFHVKVFFDKMKKPQNHPKAFFSKEDAIDEIKQRYPNLTRVSIAEFERRVNNSMKRRR